MPADETINVAAQVIASRQWKLKFRDVKAAFSQSLKSNRRRPIACRQPRGGLFPGSRPGNLILLITEVYGLVSGPAWWRVSFVKQYLDRGYVHVPMDRCALTLPGEEEGSPTKGLVLLEMDDVMEGGDEEHETFMTDIASKIIFGKIKEVRQFDEGVLFNGRRLFQDKKLWDITSKSPITFGTGLDQPRWSSQKSRRRTNPS